MEDHEIKSTFNTKFKGWKNLEPKHRILRYGQLGRFIYMISEITWLNTTFYGLIVLDASDNENPIDCTEQYGSVEDSMDRIEQKVLLIGVPEKPDGFNLRNIYNHFECDLVGNGSKDVQIYFIEDSGPDKFYKQTLKLFHAPGKCWIGRFRDDYDHQQFLNYYQKHCYDTYAEFTGAA